MPNGSDQPPRKRVTAMPEPMIMAAYSPMKKEGELHRAVLGVVAGHQFGLALGQVEGQAVGLGEHRDGEDDEGDADRDERGPTVSAQVPRRRQRAAGSSRSAAWAGDLAEVQLAEIISTGTIERPSEIS
jgi:hypothetical protein